MAAVVDDCGSNGFHEYACILDAKHEGKHVKVNPTQCAPRLTRPLPAAQRPELSSEGLAPLSRFAPIRRHRNSNTPALPAGLREYTNGEKSALNAWRCARMRLGRRCAQPFNCRFRLTRASCRTSLPAALPLLARPSLAALVGSRPSAPLRPAVPSRVEAHTRAEPSAGAQGPVLNEEAGLAECERWHGRRMQEGARARRRRQRRRWALPVAAAVGVHQEFTKLSK